MSLQTSFNAYNKLDVDITDGNMTLCFGSHGYGYAMYLNNDGTAFYAQGSEQRNPYFFRGQYGFRNDQLTKFLEEWSLIKTRITSKAKSIEAITSETFVP